MTKEKRNHVLDDNVVISTDNIELLSRVIALSALKKFQSYAYGVNKEICNLHKQLQYDIAYKKESEPFTDSYDLVQEASYFLCQYIGHKLGEFHSMSRTKNRDSIRMSCFKHLFSYLRKERLHIVNTYEDNDILEYIETNFEIDNKHEDYTKVINLTNILCKDNLEKQIIIYLYNGVEIKNIANFLNISLDKVYKRRRKFKDRYLMYKK